MKKLVLISVVLFFVLSMIYSAPAKIQVVKPADRDNYFQDQDMTIKWRFQGQLPALVKIQLVDKTGNVFVKTIAGSTQNDGKEKWRIPLNQNPGYYRVKIFSIGSNVQALSGRFKISPKMTWSAPGYAMISTLKVNGQNPSDSCTNTAHRATVNLSEGIHVVVTATSVIQPIKYKYKVELTNPENGHDYVIYDGQWTQQSFLNLNPTYNEILAKVFSNQITGTEIPLSLQGSVTVTVKNDAQTEPPQIKGLCIRLWL